MFNLLHFSQNFPVYPLWFLHCHSWHHKVSESMCQALLILIFISFFLAVETLHSMIPYNDIASMLLLSPLIHYPYPSKDLPGMGHVQINDRLPMLSKSLLFSDHRPLVFWYTMIKMSMIWKTKVQSMPCGRPRWSVFTELMLLRWRQK